MISFLLVPESFSPPAELELELKDILTRTPSSQSPTRGLQIIQVFQRWTSSQNRPCLDSGYLIWWIAWLATASIPAVVNLQES